MQNIDRMCKMALFEINSWHDKYEIVLTLAAGKSIKRPPAEMMTLHLATMKTSYSKSRPLNILAIGFC